jgi:hypothetical protein
MRYSNTRIGLGCYVLCHCRAAKRSSASAAWAARDRGCLVPSLRAAHHRRASIMPPPCRSRSSCCSRRRECLAAQLHPRHDDGRGFLRRGSVSGYRYGEAALFIEAQSGAGVAGRDRRDRQGAAFVIAADGRVHASMPELSVVILSTTRPRTSRRCVES